MTAATDRGAPKRRLLVTASTYPRWAGDPEPGFVHELAKRLTDAFDVRVLCPHAPGAARREEMDGVDVVRFRYASERLQTLVNDGGIVGTLRRAPWKWLLVAPFIAAQFFCTWRQLRSWRPDVVHAHWLIPQGLVLTLLSHLRVGGGPAFLVTSHGADLYALRTPFLSWLKSRVVKRASALTVVSSGMRRELLALGAESAKISIQPMGVDLAERFSVDPSIARSPDSLLFVGRLVEKKGLRYLLEAMPAVLAELPNTRLLVAGFGPEETARRAQVQSLGISSQVEFIGAMPQAELPDLYRRAALFVAPFVQASSGDQEGLGLVQIEAIGCGCRVLTTDLPAIADVSDLGEGITIVPPGDSASLAAAIVRLLSASDADARASAALLRQRALMRFDWAARAAQYQDILLGICRRGTGSREL